ncbi:hypothetical protein [Pedobacter sp. UYP1]|uniref:hypothetical protein n=1 Tax=Pedobacter sp. UYP1 TaxID=1756396 RepID=UPI00339968F1
MQNSTKKSEPLSAIFKLKYCVLAILLYTPTGCLFAQGDNLIVAISSSITESDIVIPKNWKKIVQSKGDLNNDGLADLVIVTQDTVDDTAPYKLQVFFTQPGGQHKLIVVSDKIISPQFPNGKHGLRSDAGFDTITINENVITIKNQLTRGMFLHKFRYQHGNFELVGFKHEGSDGLGTFYKEDFNLSTGIHFYKEERYDTGTVTLKRKEKKLIRPLPKLQNYVPFEKDF